MVSTEQAHYWEQALKLGVRNEILGGRIDYGMRLDRVITYLERVRLQKEYLAPKHCVTTPGATAQIRGNMSRFELNNFHPYAPSALVFSLEGPQTTLTAMALYWTKGIRVTRDLAQEVLGFSRILAQDEGKRGHELLKSWVRPAALMVPEKLRLIIVTLEGISASVPGFERLVVPIGYADAKKLMETERSKSKR